MLYPLKFKPVFKDKIWGGQKIRTTLGLDFTPMPNCGEAWMLSGVAGSQTEVANGFLAGNELNEVLEIYMDDLVGEKAFSANPEEFPVLVKFIDSADWLSVQVHPNDELAAQRGLGGGKTEMWYVLDAEPGATLISGFNREMNAASYQALLKRGELEQALNFEPVRAGDSFFMPAGRVHALGPGILLTEIQQTSDTTYRIHDWNRVDANGQSRELHVAEALEAIDFSGDTGGRIRVPETRDRPVNLVDSSYFTVNRIMATRETGKDYSSLDSFVIWIATEGHGLVRSGDHTVPLARGEVVLLPAVTGEVMLIPSAAMKILEVYIP